MKTFIFLIATALTVGQQIQQRRDFNTAVRLAGPGYFKQGGTFTSNLAIGNGNQVQKSSLHSITNNFQNQGIEGQSNKFSDSRSSQSYGSLQNTNRFQESKFSTSNNNQNQIQSHPFQQNHETNFASDALLQNKGNQLQSARSSINFQQENSNEERFQTQQNSRSQIHLSRQDAIANRFVPINIQLTPSNRFQSISNQQDSRNAFQTQADQPERNTHFQQTSANPQNPDNHPQQFIPSQQNRDSSFKPSNSNQQNRHAQFQQSNTNQQNKDNLSQQSSANQQNRDTHFQQSSASQQNRDIHFQQSSTNQQNRDARFQQSSANQQNRNSRFQQSNSNQKNRDNFFQLSSTNKQNTVNRFQQSNFNEQSSRNNIQSDSKKGITSGSQSQSNSFLRASSEGLLHDVIQSDIEPLNLPSGASLLLGSISTSFSCVGRPYGYYADEDNYCRVFHVCNPALFSDGKIQTSQYSFMCGEGTVFDQSKLTCKDKYDATPCQDASNFYVRNEEFGRQEEKTN